MRLGLLLSFLLIFTGILHAQSRYTIDGDTLTLDMTVEEPGYDFDGGLDAYDETEMISYLFDHPEIKTLRVTGPGGYGPAGRAISDYLIQHSINTEAFGKCDSACARIFLGGKSRQAEGISKAKERGVYANRKRKSTINVKRVKGLRDEGLNNSEIAAHMGISRMSVYRLLKGVA